MGPFASCCQVVWQSTVRERFICKFSKRFSSFSMVFNYFQIASGRNVSRVAWAAQGAEVPDPQLFVASHWLFPSCHHISVGNQISLLIHSNTFSKEVLWLRCPPALHWHDLRRFFLLCCTVSAWGQFIRQPRSRCMLDEAGNSDDR